MNGDPEWFDQKLQELERTAADIERKRLARFLLRLFIAALVLCLVMFAYTANAAKVDVHWVNATMNTDGSPLTDLVSVKVEWGSCTASNGFGTLQAAITVPAALLTTSIYPTGLSKVCARAYSINAQDVSSAASNVASKTLLSTLGKPVSLGQPIILE